MTVAFRRTTRSLERDDHRAPALGLMLVALVLGVWTLWMFEARISLLAVTHDARVEVDSQVYSIESPVSGEVFSSRLTLGQLVTAGDILLELTNRTELLQRAEEEAALTALKSRLASLRQRSDTEARARIETRGALTAALDESGAKHMETEAQARLAAEEVKRLEQLAKHGLVAEVDLERARSRSIQLASAATATRLNADRLIQEQRVEESDRQSRLEGNQAEIAFLEGEIQAKERLLERLRHAIERRQVRAAVTGRLGEVANLQPGSVVQAGQRLGAIVPDGELRVVAEFAPSEALGRIRCGQSARMRLDGFPWGEYGTVAAAVTEIAAEPRNGSIRVVLKVTVVPPTIPLQHGLPGSVEVEIEKVSPGELVLRLGGELLARPAVKLEATKPS